MSENSGQASLSAVPLSLSNAIPKYFDLKSDRSYNVLHGATEHSLGIHRASNPSSSNVSVNCPPTSSETLIHLIAWKKCTFRLTITATPT